MDEDIMEAAIAAVYGKDAHLKVRRGTKAIPTCTASVIESGSSIAQAVAPTEEQAKIKLARTVLADADSDAAEIAALRDELRRASDELLEEEGEDDEDSDDLFDSHEDEEDGDWDDEEVF